MFVCMKCHFGLKQDRVDVDGTYVKTIRRGFIKVIPSTKCLESMMRIEHGAHQKIHTLLAGNFKHEQG